METNRRVASVLAMIGGILGILGALMMLLFGLFLTGAPLWRDARTMFTVVLAWVAIASLAGGVLMTIGARGIARGNGSGPAKLTIAGGILALVGGNFLAGVLGIGAGAWAMSGASREMPEATEIKASAP